MTMEELEVARASKKKLRSRTFWITIAWMTFVPIAVIAQVLIGAEVEIPIATVVSFAGSVSLLFVGGDKGEKIAETMKVTN